ncbi:hypothetical protein ACFQ4J_06665 [Laceyella tengchongensis]|jgi:hypothetical protein
MAKGEISFKVQIDADAFDFFQKEAPEKLTLARRKAVEAAGMIWADTAKRITRDENHIDTGLFVNSIGYKTDFPATGKSGRPVRSATEDDVVYELSETNDATTLAIGSNVEYAIILEERYHIMARALDVAESRIQQVSEFQVKKTLFE